MNELGLLLMKVPTKHYLQALMYFDRSVNMIMEEVLAYDDEDKTLTNKIIERMKEIKLTDEVEISERIVKMLLGDNFEKKLDKRIITLDDYKSSVR